MGVTRPGDCRRWKRFRSISTAPQVRDEVAPDQPPTAMKDEALNQDTVLLWIPPHRSRPRGVIELLMTLLLGVILVFAACDSKSAEKSYAAVYEVEVADQERFFVALATESQIEMAEKWMAEGRVGVLHGTVARGNGGFNDPYDWHLDPATVSFPDMAMEVCDGRPESDVQADVDYWVERIGYYCPWGARLVRRVV